MICQDLTATVAAGRKF